MRINFQFFNKIGILGVLVYVEYIGYDYDDYGKCDKNYKLKL
jgi:hypothetical protein